MEVEDDDVATTMGREREIRSGQAQACQLGREGAFDNKSQWQEAHDLRAPDGPLAGV